MIAQPSGARAATTAVAARGGAPRAKGIKTRVSYAGECSLEEAVSQYLAARANSRAIPDPGHRGALDTFAARRPDGQRRAPRC